MSKKAYEQALIEEKENNRDVCNHDKAKFAKCINNESLLILVSDSYEALNDSEKLLFQERVFQIKKCRALI